MPPSPEFPAYAWYPARWYSPGRAAGQPTVIFLHTTEGSEGTDSAENMGAFTMRRADKVSPHFYADQDTAVQCVRTTDTAYTARGHGNTVGIHIEACGKAGQSAAQWADAPSAGTVERCARLAAMLRAAYRKRRGREWFPLVNLTPDQLRAGRHGFAEHLDATRAWPEDGGTHWDPGPNFPWATLFARIRALEAEAVRTLTYQTFTAALPVLRYGDVDPIEGPNTTNWVVRAQLLLAYLAPGSVTADGDYRGQTAAAVTAVMRGGDGRTINLDVWKRLYGMWSATPTG